MHLRTWHRAARRALIAWSLAAVSWTGSADAAEWAMEPSMSVKGEYNDNILITTAAHEPVWGTWFSPGTRFRLKTEIGELEGAALSDFVKYYGQSNLDITNLYFPLKGKYETERDTFKAEGGFTRDNTLVGELLQTGVVNRRTQRNSLNAHPQWQHALTETVSLTTDYQYSHVEYDNGLQFNLFNYATHYGSGGLTYKPTERDTITTNVYYLTYSVPVVKLDAHYYGSQASATHRFSETLQASAAGGFKNITSTGVVGGSNQRSTDFVWVFNGSVEKRMTNATATLLYSRDVNPSGVGFLVQTDRLGGSVTYDIAPTVTGALNADVFWISPTVSGATVPNTRYWQIQPRVHWRLSEWWSVELSYRHAQLQVDQINTSASQNATYLALTYQIPKFSLAW